MSEAKVEVKIKQLPHAEGLPLPAYATPGSAGFDLLSATETEITLKPFQRALIPTGLTLELPEGFEAQVRPRSGLAVKNGITVLNTPGTVDSDYRGEVGVILINLSQEDFIVTRGMRIAQMIIAEYSKAKLVAADSLSETERGAGGFGSTGVNTPKAA